VQNRGGRLTLRSFPGKWGEGVQRRGGYGIDGAGRGDVWCDMLELLCDIWSKWETRVFTMQMQTTF
jgi:hypothetical protein